MKVMTLGSGFVADHLPYPKITERIPVDSTYIKLMLNREQPDVLINCIGKTGRPNIDWCENNKEIVASTNVALPIVLAEVCAEKNIRLIQIGSGCIYFGNSPNFHFLQADGKPFPEGPLSPGGYSFVYPAQKIEDGWKETDFANPESYYSKSKYACDLMLGSMSHVTVLRIRMPISNKDNHRNLINKLRGYKKIIDIPNSMTFMNDLARCIEWIIKEGQTGIFHVVNPQPITAARIMREYQKYVPEHSFEIINESQLDQMTLAKRSNCILSTEKLQKAGFQMTDSEEALTRCMAEYVKNIRSTDVK